MPKPAMSELKRLTPAEIEPRPGTDFCPNCSETIARIRSRNNEIAELKMELGEALKDKENWREMAASYQAQLNKAQSDLANMNDT